MITDIKAFSTKLEFREQNLIQLLNQALSFSFSKGISISVATVDSKYHVQIILKLKDAFKFRFRDITHKLFDDFLHLVQDYT